MVRHTLKILQQMQQDFKSVSDHSGTLCIKGLIVHFEATLTPPDPLSSLSQPPAIRPS